ncbi:MAG: GntR family transcriptional regulator [Granulosicoccus sp.]|nr:GntR family transcriptional regulator [Granulosicoccus sp.]
MPGANPDSLDKTAQLLLSSQVSERLTRDIHSGLLPEGERLAPERTLAKQLKVSVGTLRKALRQLECNGLIERIQGSGNYVRRSAVADNVYALFRLQLVTGPAKPSASILSLHRMKKPSSLPLNSTADHVFRIRRLRKLADTPAALEEIWLDGQLADQLDKSKIGNSLYQYYEQQLNCRITRVIDHISVAQCPRWSPSFAEDVDPSAWGYVERWSRDQNGETREFSKTWFDPVRVRFVAR